MKAARTPFQSSSQLIGVPVRDISDQVVGAISELIVDTEEGRVAYVGIDLDVAPDHANRRVVVPWSAVRPSGEHAGNWQIAARRDSLDRLARPGNSGSSRGMS